MGNGVDMFTFKPIKVKTDIFHIKDAEKGVRKAMDTGKDRILTRYQSTTNGWGHRVDFTATATRDGYVIGTSDPIYAYVDLGTPAHVIEAKPGKTLAFSVGGSPKTQPGVIGSGGGARGDTRVFAKRVQHPGTEARGFSEAIAREAQTELPFLINEAIAHEMGGD